MGLALACAPCRLARTPSPRRRGSREVRFGARGGCRLSLRCCFCLPRHLLRCASRGALTESRATCTRFEHPVCHLRCCAALGRLAAIALVDIPCVLPSLDDASPYRAQGLLRLGSRVLQTRLLRLYRLGHMAPPFPPQARLTRPASWSSVCRAPCPSGTCSRTARARFRSAEDRIPHRHWSRSSSARG